MIIIVEFIICCKYVKCNDMILTIILSIVRVMNVNYCTEFAREFITDIISYNFLTLSLMMSLRQHFASDQRSNLMITHLKHSREIIEQVLQTTYKRKMKTLLNSSSSTYLKSSTYKTVTHLIMNQTKIAILSDKTSEKYKVKSDWQNTIEYFIEFEIKNVMFTLVETLRQYVI